MGIFFVFNAFLFKLLSINVSDFLLASRPCWDILWAFFYHVYCIVVTRFVNKTGIEGLNGVVAFTVNG